MRLLLSFLCCQDQDDVAILASQLGYIPQYHGNNIATATPLTVTASTASTFSAKGSCIISQTNQIDYFSFSAPSAGILSVTVQGMQYTNLAAQAAILNAAGIQVGLPINTIKYAGSLTGLGFSGQTRSIPGAGTYYVTVAGVGYLNALDYWGSYGSLGQYDISVSFGPGPR
jgi:hypothetical protein